MAKGMKCSCGTYMYALENQKAHGLLTSVGTKGVVTQ